jgi:hypothetical protein
LGLLRTPDTVVVHTDSAHVQGRAKPQANRCLSEFRLRPCDEAIEAGQSINTLATLGLQLTASHAHLRDTFRHRHRYDEAVTEIKRMKCSASQAPTESPHCLTYWAKQKWQKSAQQQSLKMPTSK